ncbi:MAG: radical SAM protein [Candidatus Korarchaeum sp.]|nr:radical SAM protein [Candidatus Korarchaeum sp.]MDW8035055.1 radical SAM protein [Candidatus Korarchaeum sp.]
MFRYGDWELKLSEKSHPKTLMLEISTNCNYDCLHCFRRAAREFKRCDMSLSVFQRVLEDAEKVGVRRVVLSGWGEPTSHSAFMELLRDLKRRGFQVALNTNGSKLSEQAEELVELGIDEIYLSLEALDVQLYELMRRGGNLSNLVLGLRRIFEAKLRKHSVKPEVTAIFTLTRLNLKEVAGVLRFAREMRFSEVRFSNYIDFDSELDCLSDDSCVSKLRDEMSKISLEVLETGVKVAQPNLKPSSSRSCPFVSNRALFVRCDGKVAPCIYYARSWGTKVLGISRKIKEVVLGDLKESNLIDIWRNSYARMFTRLYFLRLPSCLDCSLVDYCLITRSNDADCWGNKPSCAHCPYLHGFSFCPL